MILAPETFTRPLPNHYIFTTTNYGSFYRIVIAIAHRLSTIAKANQVVVLEQGKIIEQGSYQELINQKGKLWHYHQLQYELS